MDMFESWKDAERRKEVIAQVIRFGISGATAAFLGLAFLYVLTDVLHVWYVASSTIAFLATFIATFSLQKFWTFQEKTISRIPVQSSLSLVVAGLNFVLNAVLIYVLVDVMRVQYMVAQIIIYGFFGLFDFFIYKLVIFRT